MKRTDALKVLVEAGGRLKYHGSGFGNALAARLQQADIIKMEDGDMVLTTWGWILAKETVK